MNQQETFAWLVERSNQLDEAQARITELEAAFARATTWVTDREPTEEEFERGVVVKTCWRDGGVNMTIDVFISPPEDGYKCALHNNHADRRWLSLTKWEEG